MPHIPIIVDAIEEMNGASSTGSLHDLLTTCEAAHDFEPKDEPTQNAIDAAMEDAETFVVGAKNQTIALKGTLNALMAE